MQQQNNILRTDKKNSSTPTGRLQAWAWAGSNLNFLVKALLTAFTNFSQNPFMHFTLDKLQLKFGT